MIKTHWLWWAGFLFSFLSAEVFTYRRFYLVSQEIDFFWSELDLYLFPCNQTTPAIHLKLSSQLSTQHQSGLGCACVFRGLNTSFHKYCSYSNACAMNNHLHQENLGAWWLLPCIWTTDWTLVLLLRKSVLQNNETENSKF